MFSRDSRVLSLRYSFKSTLADFYDAPRYMFSNHRLLLWFNSTGKPRRSSISVCLFHEVIKFYEYPHNFQAILFDCSQSTPLKKKRTANDRSWKTFGHPRIVFPLFSLFFSTFFFFVGPSKNTCHVWKQ